MMDAMSEETPAGVWGDTERSALSGLCARLAVEALEAGEIDSDMVGDLREALYRWGYDAACAMGVDSR